MARRRESERQDLSSARDVRAVELFVDFRTVSGVLKARAKEFGLFKRDGGSIKPAHEFVRPLAIRGPRSARNMQSRQMLALKR